MAARRPLIPVFLSYVLSFIHPHREDVGGTNRVIIELGSQQFA
jgi:hypothetical protein